MRIRTLFAGQLQHWLLLTCLLPGAMCLARPALDDASWLGIADRTWFQAVLVLVIVHQVVVWLVFRLQLVYALFSRLFGKHDLLVWGILFYPMLLARPILTLALGIADLGSLGSYRGVQTVIGLALLVPAVYTLWSVVEYFGMTRALGGDHFRQHYRDMPLVRKGAFKYSQNAMYSFVFLVFWAIALLTHSRAALAAALFQHAYIWVHMYCTEAPDMRLIYGMDDGKTSRSPKEIR
jgi:hypothetical protein